MADMSEWTEDEKVSHLKIVHKLAAHGEYPSADEVEKLSDNVKYALIELYSDLIENARPKKKLQIVKEWFKRLLRPDNIEEVK